MSVVGGLLYVRVGANTQYVTGSSFIIVVLADSLALSNEASLMCSTVLFTPEDLVAHSKSQVIPLITHSLTHST